ncbi:MAG: OsmC family protein [Chitinophagaceae bacterium]|nr:OsmC family protein [Chitinophagaceae bacterium]
MHLTTAHIKKDHFKTHVQAGENSIIADEPADEGGAEMGFSPDELLLAALGSCTTITLRMYADRKGWALDEVKVHMTFERDKVKNTTHILRTVELKGALSEEQKKRLMVIADKCPTHQILTHEITIESKIV